MADNKKYYYLKLKDNFYESDAMILLESMENGYLYSNILMKMYLRSLRNNGKLTFNDKIPYNAQMLSKIVRHNVDIVEKAIKVFTGLELIDVLDNGTIYISDIQNFIGESSTEADRIRFYRNEIDQQKLNCTNVVQMYDKCTPEIDIELELEIEKEIDKEINKESIKPVVNFKKTSGYENKKPNENNNANVNVNLNENNNSDFEILSYIESNFGITIGGTNLLKIEDLLKTYNDEILCYGIDKCIENNAKTLNYFYKVIENWKQCDFKTIEEVKIGRRIF